MANQVIKIRSLQYYRGVKSLEDNVYQFTFRWNTFSSKWYMDIVGKNNVVDIRGIALLPGRDLITLHGYSQLGGQLWLLDNRAGAAENPTFADMGTRWTLEYIPEADL